jgi:hypothetical protein
MGCSTQFGCRNIDLGCRTEKIIFVLKHILKIILDIVPSTCRITVINDKASGVIRVQFSRQVCFHKNGFMSRINILVMQQHFGCASSILPRRVSYFWPNSANGSHITIRLQDKKNHFCP